MTNLPDDRVRETIRDLANARTKALWFPELIANADVQDELNEIGSVLMWLDTLPPNGRSLFDDFLEMVEVGKRMRAMQVDYFKTRNQQTLRTCMSLEKEFDKLLERIDQELWTKTQPQSS